MKRLGLVLACALALVVIAPASAIHYSGTHWQRGFDQPEVHPIVGDWTYSQYNGGQLLQAAIEWNNRSEKIGLGYGDWGYGDWTKCENLNNVPNGWIYVCNQYYGTTGAWAGVVGRIDWTSFNEGNGRHFGVATIRFNENYVVNLNRQAVACHELGHGIGLGHQFASNGGNSSCMKSGGGTPTPLYPNAHDLDVLRAGIYTEPGDSWHWLMPQGYDCSPYSCLLKTRTIVEVVPWTSEFVRELHRSRGWEVAVLSP